MFLNATTCGHAISCAISGQEKGGLHKRIARFITYSSPGRADTWFPSLPCKDCTGVRYVITKFSRMDGLPNFLTGSVSLARWSSAINISPPTTTTNTHPRLPNVIWRKISRFFFTHALFWQRGYRKIPKISPGAYIFQRSFWRDLILEGLDSERLIHGGKFAFQNRLGKPYSWQ